MNISICRTSIHRSISETVTERARVGDVCGPEWAAGRAGDRRDGRRATPASLRYSPLHATSSPDIATPTHNNCLPSTRRLTTAPETTINWLLFTCYSLVLSESRRICALFAQLLKSQSSVVSRKTDTIISVKTVWKRAIFECPKWRINSVVSECVSVGICIAQNR